MNPDTVVVVSSLGEPADVQYLIVAIILMAVVIPIIGFIRERRTMS